MLLCGCSRSSIPSTWTGASPANTYVCHLTPALPPLTRAVAAAVTLLRGYVIFDWDNIFATYMTSLSSKEIAYSNFIQVIRSKTAMGFVPNYSAGGTKVSTIAFKAILFHSTFHRARMH